MASSHLPGNANIAIPHITVLPPGELNACSEFHDGSVNLFTILLLTNKQLQTWATENYTLLAVA